MTPLPIRTVFFGTPEFAVPSLQVLLETCSVVAVVTQPDRPRGRGRVLAAPPVARAARERGLPVLQPARLKSPEVVEQLRSLHPDLIVTAAYGKIIPKEILDLPPLGAINVHPSLLPKHRGASPISAAILHGETTTGVTILFQSMELDAGDIILQRVVPIAPEDTARTLEAKLAAVGAEALAEALRLIAEGRAPRIPQDHALASYAGKLEKVHGRIDWTRPAHELVSLVRAMDPWPSAYTWHRGRLLKVWRAQAEPGKGAPGTVVEIRRGDGFTVGTGAGLLLILEVQPESGRRMSAGEFARGARLRVGEVLAMSPPGRPGSAELL
ncbi:MAG: methionyl-tRNA formyltransferase [Armatimonadota bacterium]|nr:methionyl-tRNA formyltransferase [Armatimonadota bacterium]MDR7451792.1 methionyl-tRNA formyltransferase [Armatimonadota bacterium]MDR7467417.1 methionyl-tRNA formyltransferase [Armatimonadota bacterium]MDR7494187.1 methionyl-tRNA formyltransferase [Armatimonadota bacterium]MDR7498847.1 methionyl-tRNA formyltransferase [Armatimonadota bacterium]